MYIEGQSRYGLHKREGRDYQFRAEKSRDKAQDNQGNGQRSEEDTRLGRSLIDRKHRALASDKMDMDIRVLLTWFVTHS